MGREKVVAVRHHNALVVSGEHDRASAEDAGPDQPETTAAEAWFASTPGARHNSTITGPPQGIRADRYIRVAVGTASQSQPLSATESERTTHRVHRRHFTRG